MDDESFRKLADAAVPTLDRVRRLMAAQRSAQSSVTLARAVLGDAAVLSIVSKYANEPNNEATRATIIADIRAALASKTQAAVHVHARGANGHR